FITPPSPLLTTLSLHDALPISSGKGGWREFPGRLALRSSSRLRPQELDSRPGLREAPRSPRAQSGMPAGAARHDRRPSLGLVLQDRKSTRLNSSHVKISYAVFC